MLDELIATLRQYAMNKTFMLALATVLSIVLAAFGIVVPHVPAEYVTAALAILTGLKAVSAEEAAYFDGLFDAIDDILEADAAD